MRWPRISAVAAPTSSWWWYCLPLAIRSSRGIVKGIQSIARQKGYNVLFSETRMNSAEFTNMLVSRQADGMILLATVPPSGVEVLSRE